MFDFKKGLSLLIGLFFLTISLLLPIYYLMELERESSIHTSEFLSNMQKEGEIFVLKMPFSLPYSNDWNHPLESEGLIEHDGEFFTVLSKNLKSDTLYIECIRNSNAREIFGSLSANIQENTSSEGPSSKAENVIIKLLNLQFTIDDILKYHFTSVDFISEKTFSLSQETGYNSPFLKTNSPPPDFA